MWASPWPTSATSRPARPARSASPRSRPSAQHWTANPETSSSTDRARTPPHAETPQTQLGHPQRTGHKSDPEAAHTEAGSPWAGPPLAPRLRRTCDHRKPTPIREPPQVRRRAPEEGSHRARPVRIPALVPHTDTPQWPSRRALAVPGTDTDLERHHTPPTRTWNTDTKSGFLQRDVVAYWTRCVSSTEPPRSVQATLQASPRHTAPSAGPCQPAARSSDASEIVADPTTRVPS